MYQLRDVSLRSTLSCGLVSLSVSWLYYNTVDYFVLELEEAWWSL